MSLEVLAIIPARGGSKGIPMKNIYPLAGKPLLAYNIESARETPSVTRVVVSTDHEEIAHAAKQYGAEVVWRPVEISGDAATSESALLHVIQHLKESENYFPDIIVFLQCTSPLTLAEDIEGTIQALLTNNADSALSVTPFHYFLWGYDKSNEVIAINHNKYIRPRRQDRDPQYVETGAVYVMRTEGLIQARHRFFGKIAMYHMPIERRLEIDDPVDMEVAEVLLRHRHDHDTENQ
jgi:N-acylneuraminate cytidylyltransferase